jgi:hypothetical protein
MLHRHTHRFAGGVEGRKKPGDIGEALLAMEALRSLKLRAMTAPDVPAEVGNGCHGGSLKGVEALQTEVRPDGRATPLPMAPARRPHCRVRLRHAETLVRIGDEALANVSNEMIASA